MSDYKSIFSDKTFGTLKASSTQSLKDMLGGKNFMQASMESMTLLPELMQAEARYTDLLEQLAKEVLIKAYPIVLETGIEIQAELVKPGQLNIQQANPPDEEEVQEFIEKTGIDRRRIINAITQGASIRGTKAYYLFKDILDALDESLIDRYNSILGNAFGIYDDDNAIAMMLAMMSQNAGSQGGESEVEWDEEQGTLVIRAKALIFPILVHELIKGLYEILSLQGFSGDAEKNKQIVGKVDRAINEPEDLRYGKFIYDALAKHVLDNNYDPAKYRELFFIEVYKLPDKQFYEFIEDSINNELGMSQKTWIQNILRSLEYENK